VGPNLWLALTLALAETLVSLKYATHTKWPAAPLGVPPGAPLWRYVPPTVYACWAVALAALGAWTALKFSGKGAARGRRTALVMNGLVAVAVVAMAYMAWSQDVGIGTNPPRSPR
jgi:hypothetical protein